MNVFSTIRSLLIIWPLLSTTAFYAEITCDLELDAVFTTINHTQSNHGTQALRSILAEPIADLHKLHSRQAVISHISENEKLNSQLNKLLEAFTEQEPHFELMMQPANDIEAAALKEFYFSSSYFIEWNYSPLHLELGQIAHFGNLCSSMVQHALAFAIFTWCLDEEHVCINHPPKKHKHHDTCGQNHKHNNAAVSSMKALARSKEFKYAFQLWHGIAQLQELYSIQAIVRNNLKCIKQLQIQLMGIARGVRIMHYIHAALQNHPEITMHLSHYNALESISTSTNISKKLTTLLTLLRSATFKGEPFAFSRIGIILAAYKLMQEVGCELEPALAAIGEIDAYVSCAYLLNNSKDHSAHYSFAQYDTTSTRPTLDARNFWHPLLTNDTITLNNISLGLHNTARNILLTGPNACGKSTNLKALMLCAYLAQTITIVPAQQYNQTLYKEIYSSIVVSDNIQKNESLFVAELTHAEELLTRTENLQEGEFILIALDELFKSTHHEKGQNVAYQLLENLYACPNVITIVSTHFEKLIELAGDNNDMCSNYTVDNFVLQPGIGIANNAFDIVDKKTKSRLLQ